MNEFEVSYSKIIHNLSIDKDLVNVSSNYLPYKSFEELFEDVWKLEKSNKELAVTLVSSEKNDKAAEEYRQKGNKCYKDRQFQSSLELYNKSICYATMPDNSKASTVPSNSLALSYANRSAVMFELGQYEKCLHDINRALNNGYPKIIKSKLVERQAKCLIALKQYKEAKQELNSCLTMLSTLGLDDKKLCNTKQDLENLLQNCASDSEIQHELQNKDKNTSSLLHFNCPEAPLLKEYHPNVPSLSNAITVAYSADKGRHLIANKDIYPGEILMNERSFSSVLLGSSLQDYCSNCMHHTSTPVPCPHCTNVIFCDEKCFIEAWSKFHSVECSIWSTLTTLDMGENPFLAYRIMVQLGLSNLKEAVNAFKNEEALKCDGNEIGFNNDGKYLSDDYRTIYYLVTNKEKRSVGDIYKRCLIALMLVKVLIASGKYFDETSDDYEDDIQLCGSTILRHLMGLACNAHSNLVWEVINKKDIKANEIGASISSVLGLSNHSCNPNCERLHYGPKIILRATDYIKQEQEVRICYGQYFPLVPRETRLKTLKRKYYFVCCCEACEEDWPSYDLLSSKPTGIKCPFCYKGLIKPSKRQCTNCNKKIIDQMIMFDSNLEFEKLSSKLKKFETDFTKCIDSVSNGKIDGSLILKLEDFILFCQKYCMSGLKLVQAQEMLTDCYNRNAWHYYRSN